MKKGVEENIVRILIKYFNENLIDIRGLYVQRKITN